MNPHFNSLNNDEEEILSDMCWTEFYNTFGYIDNTISSYVKYKGIFQVNQKLADRIVSESLEEIGGYLNTLNLMKNYHPYDGSEEKLLKHLVQLLLSAIPFTKGSLRDKMVDLKDLTLKLLKKGGFKFDYNISDKSDFKEHSLTAKRGDILRQAHEKVLAEEKYEEDEAKKRAADLKLFTGDMYLVEELIESQRPTDGIKEADRILYEAVRRLYQLNEAFIPLRAERDRRRKVEQLSSEEEKLADESPVAIAASLILMREKDKREE